MQIIRIAGTTRTLGKAQGYLGLPLRDIVVDDPVNGPSPAMETAWEPTPDELSMLNAGAPVILCILGSGHPPVVLRTGDLPEDALLPRSAQFLERELDAATAELSAIAAAIGSVRWMDPPDGGDVSLAEQVRRMRADLEAAEREE